MGDSSEDFLDVLTAVQEGEFEVVQEMINGRFVSANALDNTGCSLLHWAAINNRIVIARLLIENGLNKASPGGVLGETPLHWAMRKRYYTMMELIFKHTSCDLTLKSSQGNDPLFLACKLGDVNAAFLLLHWGASVETTDLNNDTPLLWLLKNKPTAPGTSTHELIKLLLRFGASALASNPIDGNNALHTLVNVSKPCYKTAFLLYQAAGPTVKLAVNNDGVTPYQLAISADKREFTRFLYDAMMFDVLPYWSPVAAVALLVAALFFAIKVCGIVYGTIYWGILYTASSWALLQWQVNEHRSRSTTGAFIGLLTSQLLSYRYNISHDVSVTMNIFVTLIVVVYSASIYFFVRRKPLVALKSENRTIAEAILQSAPTEGTDEEFVNNGPLEGTDLETAELPDPVEEEHNEYSSLIAKSSDNVKFVKDSFTGQLRRVDSSTFAAAPRSPKLTATKTTTTKESVTSSDINSVYHGRGLGPKLCGGCLCDRRTHTRPITNTTLPFWIERFFIPTADGSRAPAMADKGDVIAIATHCACCNACVVDQDHHSLLLGNCVGKGNRRIYWLFLFAGMLFCLFYFFTAKYVQHYVTCADDVTLQGWGPLTWLRVEYCVMTRKGSFFALSWLTAYLGTYLLVTLQIQVTSVVRETTYANVMKGRYERQPPPPRRRMRNLLAFLYSGVYTVTYPKTDARGRASSVCSVDNTNSTNNSKNTSSSNNSSGLDNPSDEKAKYERAMKMLKNIDSAISGKPVEEEVDVESVVENNTVTGKSSTAVYTAPSVEIPVSSAPAPVAAPKACHSSDCKHCEEPEDTFSDYDTEFIESDRNNYATYYFHDSDGENDTSGRDHSSHQYDHSSSAHGHASGHMSGAGHSSGHVHGPGCNHDHSHGHSHGHDHSHASHNSNSSSKGSKKNMHSSSILADERV
eukprot:CAMPEP_0185006554 /NCGR_PEP_ID=MMETSP1098-20130426/84910_1 /TAXON_ID=89044 /ORGANISM="Spumella elongata, Strain CCAP 955/1" /LENGTH=918 /DNA_ID=CAMNT_0027534737 /DNA_START=41 /DNA_END=2800 /DNA_ORIENTATION=+